MCFYAKDDFDGPAQEIIQVKQGTVMAFDGRTTLHEGRLDSEVSTFFGYPILRGLQALQGFDACDRTTGAHHRG